MKPSSQTAAQPARIRPAFSLVEVVLAVGVLSLAIAALVGLFGPTVDAVRDVVESDAALGVQDRMRAILQTPDNDGDAEVEGLSFDDVWSAASAPSPAKNLILMWNERTYTDGVAGPPVFQNFRGAGTAFTAAISAINTGVLDGPIYAAVLQPVEGFAYSADAEASAGMVPIKVTILTVDPDALAASGGITLAFDGDKQINFDGSDFSRADVLIEYVTGRRR